MAYIPFYAKFPLLAEQETRSMTTFNDPILPKDTYMLLESYCDDPGCDCRRVFFNVISIETNKVLAIIAFGWETNKYYEKWMGDNDPIIIKDLKGPVLNTTSPQSKFAPKLLELVDSVVLKDSEYIERLKRHYKLFKETINKEAKQKKTSSKKYAN